MRVKVLVISQVTVNTSDEQTAEAMIADDVEKCFRASDYGLSPVDVIGVEIDV